MVRPEMYCCLPYQPTHCTAGLLDWSSAYQTEQQTLLACDILASPPAFLWRR